MIKINFQEPTSEEWQEWRQKCDAARDEMIESFENGQKLNVTNLYKDLRMQSVYKSGKAPFYGKCVYCESDVLVNQPGDIEHWRPKNRVTDEKGCIIKIETEDGTTVSHPGYYWLAYEWRNLLLACADCNRPSKAKTDRRIGKSDQFPVEDFRATKMGEESQESPILLNPVEEDPAAHLEVDDTGVIIAKTDRGQKCIDIFGLNDREALRDARRECIKNTKSRIESMVWKVWAASRQDDEEDAMRELSEKVEEIESGAAPFSACGRLALHEFRNKLERLAHL